MSDPKPAVTQTPTQENDDFEMRGPCTLAIREGRFEFEMDEVGLEQSIRNIEATRDSYATEEAYQRPLEMRKRALVFLRMKINAAWEKAAQELERPK